MDELYGIEKYLHKIGGTAKAAVEADVQLARAARSQAQTMIGSVQYNVFSDKPERMGDGLLEIYKPTRLWSQEKYTAFDNYLLHQLNIDRMTLESRSKTWTAAERAQIAKVEGDIPLSEDDFANLADHIHNFDGVLSINDYNGKTEVHLYRKSEQGYYQIITVVSSERKSLQITKLIGVSSEKFEQKFAKKIERNTGSPRMHLASTPSTKARHTAGVLSTNSIPDSAKKINPSDEILFLV